MEPITTTAIATALGYILKASAESKAVGTAKEELLEGFWNWIRPLFLEDDPQLEKQLEEKPDDEAVQQQVLKKLTEAHEKSVELQTQLSAELQKLKSAGITEKNIVGSITDVDEAHVGDTTNNPNESYDRKNIVDEVKNVKKFRLGDGN
jgi:hypothetical protein